MRSGKTLNMKCLRARWFGLQMSAKKGRLKIGKALVVTMIASCLGLWRLSRRAAESRSRMRRRRLEDRATRIESALFTRAEFFGAEAIIPYPTGEARARLAEVRKSYPQGFRDRVEASRT